MMTVFCPSCSRALEQGAESCPCGWESAPPPKVTQAEVDQARGPAPSTIEDSTLRAYARGVLQAAAIGDEASRRRMLEDWESVLVERSREIERDRAELARRDEDLVARAREVEARDAAIDDYLEREVARLRAEHMKPAPRPDEPIGPINTNPDAGAATGPGGG